MKEKSCAFSCGLHGATRFCVWNAGHGTAERNRTASFFPINHEGGREDFDPVLLLPRMLSDHFGFSPREISGGRFAILRIEHVSDVFLLQRDRVFMESLTRGLLQRRYN
ncbi:hypothetical protein Nepgr_028451 [Nepenthes gracilis]|uniref:Uncharacterized protein n=1 Tax=Nepenthes gracilis TaxID=150966 RepID=A0AAD3Y2F2_NEPGR|nr:hypothetical protein Nepgr_028451 [Nepenthes gracilis]